MSIRFNWFKDYKLVLYDDYYNDYCIVYQNNGSTSFSAGNIIKYNKLISKYTHKEIPTINDCGVYSEDYKLDLIEPFEMSNICSIILNTKEIDAIDARDRFEWFEKLSDEGYYLSFDTN